MRSSSINDLDHESASSHAVPSTLNDSVSNTESSRSHKSYTDNLTESLSTEQLRKRRAAAVLKRRRKTMEIHKFSHELPYVNVLRTIGKPVEIKHDHVEKLPLEYKVNTWQSRVNGTEIKALDTWPARCQPPSYLPALRYINDTYKLQVRRTDMHAENPKFLIHMEKFIQEELCKLRLPDQKPCKRRLQVFRRVFEIFANEFHTYKPILRILKYEYESYMLFIENQIEILQPLKEEVINIGEKEMQRQSLYRKRDKEEIKQLEHQCVDMKEVNDAYSNQHESMLTIIASLRSHLTMQYKEYRKAEDSKKLLRIKIDDLENNIKLKDCQILELVGEKGELSEVNSLQIALKVARKDHDNLTDRMTYIESSYSDVIPRKEHEQLQEIHGNLVNIHNKTKEKLGSVENSNQIMEEEIFDLRIMNAKMTREIEEMTRSRTPRPSWDRCSRAFVGGRDQWHVLTDGLNSDQKVEVLLGELNAKSHSFKDEDQNEYFQGLGLDESIPPYLRWEGNLMNLNISLKETIRLINSIWIEKRGKDPEQQDAPRIPLREFLDFYMDSHSEDRRSAVEAIYNLIGGCKRFSGDETVNSFFTILQGTQDEEVEHDFSTILNNLKNRFIKIDQLGDKSGMLTTPVYTKILSRAFPYKTETRLKRLYEMTCAQIRIQPGYNIPFKKVFLDIHDLCTTELRKQFRLERNEYAARVFDNIPYPERPSSEKDQPVVIGVWQVKEAIMKLDHYISKDILDDHICWIFSLDFPTDKEVKLSPEKLKERLMGSALRMTEPSEESNLARVAKTLLDPSGMEPQTREQREASKRAANEAASIAAAAFSPRNSGRRLASTSRDGESMVDDSNLDRTTMGGEDDDDDDDDYYDDDDVSLEDIPLGELNKSSRSQYGHPDSRDGTLGGGQLTSADNHSSQMSRLDLPVESRDMASAEMRPGNKSPSKQTPKTRTGTKVRRSAKNKAKSKVKANNSSTIKMNSSTTNSVA